MTEPLLAAGGDAVARHEDGRVIFVTGAAPGDEVTAKVTKNNKRFLRAEVVEVRKPGAARVEPRCEYFGTCGGCTLQHVSHEAQIASKQAALRENLARIGGVDAETVQLEEPWVGEPFGYRSRARLVRAPDGQLGFRALGSRRVVDVSRCHVLSPELQEVLTALRAALSVPSGSRSDGPRQTDEINLVSTGERVVGSLPEHLLGAGNAAARASGVPVDFGEDALAEVDDGHGPISLSPRVFSQASRAGNQALVEHVARLLPDAPVSAVDLYAGSGNFTHLLAGRANQVVAFEGDRAAVALARRGAADNVTVQLGAVEDTWIRWVAAGGEAQVAVMDPPRAGAPAEVLAAFAKAGVTTIVYVSCDPATWARDVKLLSETGYRLDSVRLFDLYPQTAHCEVVGRLVLNA